MSTWISAKTVKVFVFSMTLYLLVVLLNYLSPVSGDGVLAQRFHLVLYIAPALIVAATIFDIYRERARSIKDASHAQRDESRS
ncbi:MAG: hypothetical protein HC783_16840 [Rhodobacteraceae bacterium]|nr:hypothetical protein [Paracoccaceae bacterium]